MSWAESRSPRPRTTKSRAAHQARSDRIAVVVGAFARRATRYPTTAILAADDRVPTLRGKPTATLKPRQLFHPPSRDEATGTVAVLSRLPRGPAGRALVGAAGALHRRGSFQHSGGSP